MLDSVIEKLRKEQLCHRNEVTGCEIWTGDFNRAGRPVMGATKVREYIFTAASGEMLTRSDDVKMLCENDACILAAHMERDTSKRKAREPLPEDDIRDVEQEYFVQGSRIDVIAEAHGWSKPYVTRLVAEARSRRGA